MRPSARPRTKSRRRTRGRWPRPRRRCRRRPCGKQRQVGTEQRRCAWRTPAGPGPVRSRAAASAVRARVPGRRTSWGAARSIESNARRPSRGRRPQCSGPGRVQSEPSDTFQRRRLRSPRGRRDRMKALPTSVVALLVSEACNVNPAPVVDPGYEARTRARFVHVDQHPPEALTPPSQPLAASGPTSVSPLEGRRQEHLTSRSGAVARRRTSRTRATIRRPSPRSGAHDRRWRSHAFRHGPAPRRGAGVSLSGA